MFIKKIYFIIKYINLVFLLPSYYSMYILSFDKDYSGISTKLRQRLEILYQQRTEYITSPEIININTDTISADQDHSIKLQLPYKTGDLGSDIMELLYVKKAGKLFSIKNYNVTYFLNEENVIHSIYPNIFLDDIEGSVENDVDCSYTILDNKFLLEYYHKNNKFIFSKFIFFSYITLGLDVKNNTVKRILYNNNNLYEIDIYDKIKKGKEYFNSNNGIKIINMYKIEQLMFNKGFIVFLVESIDNNAYLLFYEIYCSNKDFFLDLEDVINLENIKNNAHNIEKIGFSKIINLFY